MAQPPIVALDPVTNLPPLLETVKFGGPHTKVRWGRIAGRVPVGRRGDGRKTTKIHYINA